MCNNYKVKMSSLNECNKFSAKIYYMKFNFFFLTIFLAWLDQVRYLTFCCGFILSKLWHVPISKIKFMFHFVLQILITTKIPHLNTFWGIVFGGSWGMKVKVNRIPNSFPPPPHALQQLIKIIKKCFLLIAIQLTYF